MDELIEQFEKDLRVHLETTFAASPEPDPIIKLNQTEQTVFEYVDSYLLETTLIAKDVERPIQHILDEFAKSKIKYID